MTLISQIQTLTKSGLIKLLETVSTDDLLKLKLYLDTEYHNGCGIVDDWRYDLIQSKTLDNSIGAPLYDGEVKIKLPYWLGSLDKLKPDNIDKIKKYISSDSCLIMDKLDGISCLLVNDNTNTLSLYTRGDGVYGKDITYISRYIRGIPSTLPVNIYVRGELVISKANFKKMGYDVCSRNVVSGAVKSKKVSEVLFNVDFISYELINGNYNIMKQFELLETYKLKTVFHKKYNSNELCSNSNDNLSMILERRKKESLYDIDGIVVHSINDVHNRNTSGNPKYAFAYKEDMIEQTTVIDVEWNVSKSGFLKPIVKVTPIVLCGALVSATSGYNARFIVDNKIGKNAVISITRSGEVIPKIVDVIKPTDNEIVLPENCEWNSTNVELKIIEKDNNDMKAKELVHFAKVLNIKCIGESTASKLVENGIDTPLKLLQCKEADLGLSSIMSSKIHNNIQKAWNEATLEQKMHASGYFNNLGVSTFKLIMDNTKDFSSIDNIVKIQGIGPIMAKSFVDGYPNFYKFHSTIEPDFYTKKVEEIQKTSATLQGKVYCYSGFRDYKVLYNGDMISINEVITKNGGIVVNSMSKKVSCLIVAGDDITKKVEDANKYNIKIISIQQLVSSKDVIGEL